MGLYLIFGILLPSFAFADEFHVLYRGARAQAMGNAFVAVVDDDEAIFYNPAGLASIDSFVVNAGRVDVDFSSDLVKNYSTFATAVGNSSISGLNALIGKSLYVRAQGTSSFSMPNFGVAVLYDEQAALRLNNQALPQGYLAAQETYGAQIGFSTRLAHFKKRKGELRLGFAGKSLWRGGGYQQPSLTQMLGADTKTITSNLTSVGAGYGLDAGLQLIYKLKRNLTFQSGLVMTDVGGTSFSSSADMIKSNLTLGLAGIYKSSDLTATLAYDYAHILESADWKKKSHLGLELKFSILSLYSGLSEFYPTYGAGLNILMLHLMYLSYAEELSSVAGQNAERRQMVELAVRFSL